MLNKGIIASDVESKMPLLRLKRLVKGFCHVVLYLLLFFNRETKV